MIRKSLTLLPSLIVPKILNLTLNCEIIGLIYLFCGGFYLLTIKFGAVRETRSTNNGK